MDKKDIGKVFTTDGTNTWELVWVANVLGVEGEHTYHMRDIDTGEELTQLVFYLKGETNGV